MPLRAQVAQVLLNLLNNAFDAVRKPVKQIRLRAGVQGDRVEIMVEDNGPRVQSGNRRKTLCPLLYHQSRSRTVWGLD